MPLGKLPSTSVNFLYGQDTFCKLSSTFHAAGRLSVHLHLLSVLPGDLPSTSINFPCSQKTFHQLSARPGFVWPKDIPATSDIFPYRRETFRQLSSTFFAAGRPSFNFPCSQKTFRQLSARPGLVRQLPSTFRVAERYSGNFRYPSVPPGDFLSTSINFGSGRADAQKFAEVDGRSHGHTESSRNV